MKHYSTKPMKKDTHKSILVSLPKDLLELLDTLIPNYKRSALITSLLTSFIDQHSQDPVLIQDPDKQPIKRKKK